jgi:hypothetical protein
MVDALRRQHPERQPHRGLVSTSRAGTFRRKETFRHRALDYGLAVREGRQQH